MSNRAKWIACGVVAVAAVAVVGAHVARRQAASAPAKAEYATALAVPAAASAVAPAAADGWGAPLKMLAELNVVATNTDAVFVVVPGKDDERTVAIQREVAAAAVTIRTRGSRMGTFVLNKDAPEAAVIGQQTGVPVVLAMYKGRGMAAVKDAEVTQDGLLKAFVASSRPSACGPSGCGPSGGDPSSCPPLRCASKGEPGMEWIRSLLAGASHAFDQAGGGVTAVPLAFALGLLSALVSACCALPVLSVVVGYAGTRSDRGVRSRLVTAGVFTLGAALALVLLGVVAAAVGQVAQTTLGRYWKVFAGVAAIVLGLGAMGLLPFSVFGAWRKVKAGVGGGRGWLGTLGFGFVGGGAVSVCSLACNPGIFIILGAAMLQGFTVWMAAILVAYSLGFALPLGALMLGVSLATAAAKWKGLETWVRRVAGVVLVGVGFYFLWTF